MSKPAHKQDDPAKSPGQIVNDITLGDYLARKNWHEAFDQVASEKGLKKKMFDTFNSVEDINNLLLTLRIAHDNYPPNEARYVSISDFIKEYNNV